VPVSRTCRSDRAFSPSQPPKMIILLPAITHECWLRGVGATPPTVGFSQRDPTKTRLYGYNLFINIKRVVHQQIYNNYN
jgi:hypothetical protein